MDSLEEKVESLEGKVDSLEEKVESLEGKMDSLEEKVESLEGKMDSLKEKVESLEEQTRNIDGRLARLEIVHETDVLPRLRSIESCYTATYKRYQDGISDYEGMKQDIQIIKKVVTEHSIKLEQIS